MTKITTKPTHQGFLVFKEVDLMVDSQVNPISWLVNTHYALMRFFYLKETLTDITAESIFEKFTLIQKTLFSCTFGTDWDKNSKSGLTIGHLRKQD